MSYTTTAVLGVAGAVLLDLVVLRTRLVTGVTFWLTYPIVLFFQLLSNGVLTGLEIVSYHPDAIIGRRIAYAPVEDLAFGFALVLATLSVWVWLGRSGPITATPRVTATPRDRTDARPDRRTPGTGDHRLAAGSRPARPPAAPPRRDPRP